MRYTFDTNILIRLHQTYPRDVFPGMWDRVEGEIRGRRACICSLVREEVCRGDDELVDWVKAQEGFVHESTDEEYETVANILERHPGWVEGTTNEADPFVIAHAKREGSTIMTNERASGNPSRDKNFKIPHVAGEEGVSTVNLFQYVRTMGWRF